MIYIYNNTYEFKNTLRICGFETFGKFIIRIDILERLFLEIISKSKNYRFKLDSKLLNLLGCNKEDFIKFIKYLDYKIMNNDDDIEFKFAPKKEKKNAIKVKQNAFSILKKLKI